ncbi:protein kinase [Nonomuraea sp. NPDC005983]|uniref:protein kinase domain-containing protein n=1 Tax=Nonomuraea sp. NPDC005983 TaxID=3155595 RepID=UPI0033AAED03
MSDPQRVGDYAIARRLGSGGQAVVYEGYGKAGERVAVKVLHEKAGLGRPVAKEVAAARRVAPFCTARILDAQFDGAQPYIVSEYVDGPNLREAVTRNGPYSGDALRRLAIGIVTAVAAIHDAGVAHCDLKPDNVLLGPDGPRVIDFGIARIVDNSLTTLRGIMGTPGYMPPELFSGGLPTPAADMFAWGSVIVFAGTGTAPFARQQVAAAIFDVLRKDVDMSTLEEPLRSLVSATLAKDPESRPTAREVLLGLLEGVGDGSLLQAGSRIAAEMHGEAVDPHLGEHAERAFDTLSPKEQGAADQLLLRIVHGDGSVGSVDPNELGGTTIEPAMNALADSGVLHVHGGHVSLANFALIQAWPRLRDLIADEGPGLSTYQRLREAARAWDLHGRREGDLYQGAALEQATTWAATARRRLELTPVERAFLASSASLTQRRLRRRRLISVVLTVLLVASATFAGLMEVNRRAFERQRDEAVARQLATRSETLRESDPTAALLLSAAAATTADLPDIRKALIGSLAQPSLVRRTTQAVGLGQDGRSIVEIKDGAAVISDGTTGRTLARVPGVEREIKVRVAFLSADRRYLATAECKDEYCNYGPTVTIRSTADGKQVGRSVVWRDGVLDRNDLRFDADGRLLRQATCGKPAVFAGPRHAGTLVGCTSGSSVGVADAGTGRVVSQARAGGSDVPRFAQLSPDGRLLAVQRDDTNVDGDPRTYFVDVWTVSNGVLGRRAGRAAFPLHETPVMNSGSNECWPEQLIFDPSAKILAGEDCGQVVIWGRTSSLMHSPTMPNPREEEGWRPMEVLQTFEHPVGSSIAFTSDGDLLTMMSDGELRTVDARPLTHATARIGSVKSAAFSHDGRLLAVMNDRALRVVDASSGRLIHEFRQPWVSPDFTAAINGLHLPPLRFSPDGRLLAVNGDGAEVVLIDVTTWRVVAEYTLAHDRSGSDSPTAGSGDILAMDFSADGTSLAVAVAIMDDNSPVNGLSVHVWNTRTGRETRVVKDVYAETLAFAPDGTNIVVGHPDDGVCVVVLTASKSTCQGRSTQGFRMPGYSTESMGFTPDGKHALLRVADGSAVLWDPQSGRTAGPVMRGHTEDWISTAAFTGDGKWLATGGYDNTVRLWDIGTGTAIGPAFRHDGDVLAVAFGDEGRTLRSVDSSGGVHAYPLDLDRTLKAVCARASRDLSDAERALYGVPEGAVCKTQ